MKTTLLGGLLACLSWTTTMACETTGIKGQISEDGQSIASRQTIPLKEQARAYGGYERAADYMAQNRVAVLQSGQYSRAVKDRVSSDMLTNEQSLRCWAAVCKEDNTDPGCQF
jgi:hypothetical protein